MMDGWHRSRPAAPEHAPCSILLIDVAPDGLGPLAARLLKTVDVIVHDDAVDEAILARLPATCFRVVATAEHIDRRCIALARQGWRVARLLAGTRHPAQDEAAPDRESPDIGQPHPLGFSFAGIAG